MIYAISTVGAGYFKFGVSHKPGQRLANLQTACPLELVIVAVVDWPSSYEAKIHTYLEHGSIRGEWFEDSYRAQQVINFMQNNDLAGFISAHAEHVKPKEKTKPSIALAPLSREERRRNERMAWWEKHGQPVH